MDARTAWALTHIERRLADPLSVAALAADVNLSASRFAHLFRRDVGTSPTRYLHAVRILRAPALLERAFLTVKEVMAQVDLQPEPLLPRLPPVPRHRPAGMPFGDPSCPDHRRHPDRERRDERGRGIDSSSRQPTTESAKEAAASRRAPGIEWNPRFENNQWITIYQGAPIMKRAALMFALTLFTSMVTTARADAQILGQLLAPNIAIPVVNAGPGTVFNGTFTLRR